MPLYAPAPPAQLLGEAKNQQSQTFNALTYVDIYDLAIDFMATTRPFKMVFEWSSASVTVAGQRLFVAFMVDATQWYERTRLYTATTDTSGGVFETGAIEVPPGRHNAKLQAKVGTAAGQSLTLLGGNLPLYEYSLVLEQV